MADATWSLYTYLLIRSYLFLVLWSDKRFLTKVLSFLVQLTKLVNKGEEKDYFTVRNIGTWYPHMKLTRVSDGEVRQHEYGTPHLIIKILF